MWLGVLNPCLFNDLPSHRSVCCHAKAVSVIQFIHFFFIHSISIYGTHADCQFLEMEVLGTEMEDTLSDFNKLTAWQETQSVNSGYSGA